VNGAHGAAYDARPHGGGILLGTIARRRFSGPALLVGLATALLAWLPAAARADTAPAFTSAPVIQGDAVVGATLAVSATWTGDPPPKVRYTWAHCPATGGACQAIVGATAAQYVVAEADVGYRLVARVHLRNTVDMVTMSSVTTNVVVAAPPPPPPPPPPPDPAPPPAPAPVLPVPTPGPTSTSAAASSTAPLPPAAAAGRPALLRPFPIVRIRGFLDRGGARITLLSVSGPRSARIAARCVGQGCPVAALSPRAAPARLRAFERFLRAGIVLQIRVTQPGSIGKYASFRIRAHGPPVRSDRCLLPGDSKPIECPSR
jgi:hypothetical protein